MEFKGKTPCANCPYRKDAPRRLWAKEEFADLLESENGAMGKTYGCHKKNGTVCRGWLMNQDKRHFPSIALRIQLSNQHIHRKYLDSLHCKSEMFESVQEMCEANYPELKDEVTEEIKAALNIK